jgi:hypothetical protein
MKEGIKLAEEIIASGKATETLEKFIEVSNRLDKFTGEYIFRKS